MNINQQQRDQETKPEDNRKLQLYKEIETYRSKIQEYQQLEKEINQINIHIDHAYTHHKPQTKPIHPKNMPENKSKPATTRRNSHKKVKIYQLQKKMDKLNQQFREKNTNFLKNQQNYNQIIQKIKEQTQKIQEENNKSQNLKKTQQQIQQELIVTSEKISQQLEIFQQSVKNTQLLNFQRKGLRDQQRKLRFKISNFWNNRDIQELELSLSETEEKLSLNSESIEDQQRNSPDITFWIGQYATKIEKLLDRIDIFQQKCQEMTKLFYHNKKEITSNEMLVKHHKLTVVLLNSQLKNYTKLADEAKERIAKTSTVAHQLLLNLNKDQGERGFLRGRIGVKIEEQRLLMALNILLEEDRDKIKQKLTSLVLIKTLLLNRNQ